jgi:hypothetical protein
MHEKCRLLHIEGFDPIFLPFLLGLPALSPNLVVYPSVPVLLA